MTFGKPHKEFNMDDFISITDNVCPDCGDKLEYVCEVLEPGRKGLIGKGEVYYCRVCQEEFKFDSRGIIIKE